MRNLLSGIAAAALLASLGACTGTSQVPTASQLITDGQTAIQSTGAVITEAQSAACLVQSVANLAAGMSSGGAASTLNTASSDAGKACTWTNPVTPASGS